MGLDASLVAGLYLAASAALAAGLAGSLHCLAMCGLWACAPLPQQTQGSRYRFIAAWHLGRLGAYAGIGAAWGAFGAGVGTLFPAVRSLLPWLMVVGLIATALDVGKRLKPLPGLTWLTRRASQLSTRLSRVTRSLALGALTPLLPCGLLYGMFLAAAGTGTAIAGATVMFFFSLGAVPALLAAQWQQRWFQGASNWVRYGRAALFIAAAAVLAWRIAASQLAPEAPCHEASPSGLDGEVGPPAAARLWWPVDRLAD
jgi:sulfite exporter TauE/SafE